MSGLFRRLSSRRSDGPEGAEPPAQAEQGAADAPANAPAEPGGHHSLLVDPAAQTRVLRDDDQPTTFQAPGEAAGSGREGAPAPGEAAGTGREGAPAPGEAAGSGQAGAATPAQPQAPEGDPARTIHPVVRLPGAGGEPHAPQGAAPVPMLPVSDLPAGVDPDELAAAPPTSARRSRLRRRVSFLRAAREVLLRDLGGFVYELHRTAGDIEHEAHRRLREVKLSRLTRLDAELHELELRLDDVRRHVVVREPGVGGECPHCGELFGSDAHYCAHCGLPLTESARRAVAHEAPPAQPAAHPQPPPPHDEPTVEYSPLRAGDPEFRWPPRPEREEASAQAGDAPAAGEAPTGVIAGSDTPASASAGETAEPEAPAAPVGTPAPVRGGTEPGAGSASEAPATGAAASDQATAPDAAPEAPAGDEAPAPGAAPEARAGDAPDAAPEAPAGDEAPASDAAAGAAPAGPDAGREGDETAGRNGSAFSPAERRR
jgi:hypothetical protein